MTGLDPTLPTRQATVTHLRADAALAALLPPAQNFGERTPSNVPWPFTRYGIADLGPTGGRVTLHVFSKGQFTDEAAAIASALVDSLDEQSIDIGDGRKASFAWVGTQILPDGAEADAWHGIVRFDVMVPRGCRS